MDSHLRLDVISWTNVVRPLSSQYPCFFSRQIYCWCTFIVFSGNYRFQKFNLINFVLFLNLQCFLFFLGLHDFVMLIPYFFVQIRGRFWELFKLWFIRNKFKLTGYIFVRRLLCILVSQGKLSISQKFQIFTLT